MSSAFPQTVSAEAPKPADPAFSMTTFRFEGNKLVDEPTLQDAVLAFRGKDRHLADLVAVKQTIAELYEERGWRMVAVGLPSKIGTDGVVTITIREIPLDGVRVSDQQYSSETDIRAALPALREGETVNFTRLATQLALSNDNAARKLAVDFESGEDKAVLAKVRVQETNPMRLGASVDNRGTASSGRYRFGVFGQHQNLWGRGHGVTAGFTTSDMGPDKVSQGYALYTMPLPSLGGQINLNASYSDADTGVVANVFKVSGQGYNFGAHYGHFLQRDAVSRQMLDVGYDEKRNINTVDFFGTNLGVDVNSRPISLNYQASQQGQSQSWSVSFGYAHNLPVGDKNDDATYNASRFGASSDWDIWRASLDYMHNLPEDWRLRFNVDGQYAGEPLISVEQIGLGGSLGVRGFQEREVLGDNGLRGSIEIYTPAFIGQTSRFLAFYDAGAMRRENAQVGEPDGSVISSAGVGCRVNLGSHITARLDGAHVIDGAATTADGDNNLHFQVIGSF